MTPVCKAMYPNASAVWILLSEEGWFVMIRAGGGLRWFPLASRRGGSALLLGEMSGLSFTPVETESTPKEIIPAYYVLFFHSNLDQCVDFVCFS